MQKKNCSQGVDLEGDYRWFVSMWDKMGGLSSGKLAYL
jgi:hypothetical protein